MRGLLLFIALLGISFVLLDLDPPAKNQGEISENPEDRIKADLRIEVDLHGLRTLQAGATPWGTASLINTSKSVTHCVVKPGDGSEVGWREPYVFWTGTIDRGDGKPLPLSKEGYGRCGHFDFNWIKDAIRLQPGDRLPLGYMVPPTLQKAGRVRLRAHYSYRHGKRTAGRVLVEDRNIGLMTGVPSFEIISEPATFDVVRPLDVRVKAKRALKVMQETRLSDLIEVVLVNQSPDPIRCSSPTLAADARLELEIDGLMPGWQPFLSEEGSTSGIHRMIKPGQAITILGPGEFANGLDGTWEYPVEDTVKLRAVYTTSTWKPGGARIQSDWVDLKVEK